MSSKDWERLLTAHYLREDGPFGASLLTWLDATPAELAIAGGLENATDSEAQREFLAQLDRGSVQDWLDGRRAPPSQDGDVPGYFRYLVLTALVSATDEGAGDSRDFRKRLGELLGHWAPFQAVSRVNRLWEALAGWTERQRAAGEPIRRVELPDPSTMTLIGRAVRIAFPSWSDRQALTQILSRLPTRIRKSPRRLVEELARPHYNGLWSPALSLAFDDFAAGLQAGRVDLGHHRFWRLVESVEQRLEDARPGPAKGRWRLDVTFGGVEHDEVDLEVHRRVPAGQSGAPIWIGSLTAFLEADARALPADLVRTRDQGLLVLGEAPGGRWGLDDIGPAPGYAVVLLSRPDGSAPRSNLPTRWSPVEGKWVASDPVDLTACAALLANLGLRSVARERLLDVGLEDGVPTRRGSWLGRPGFLPCVRAPQSAALFVSPATARTHGTPGLDAHRRLRCEAPLTGGWHVTARAGGGTTECLLYLEADAAERDTWPAFGVDFAPDPELGVDATIMAASAAKLVEAQDPPEALLDLLEAVYARGSRTFGEAEFIALLERALPCPGLAWDVMRAFAESGWAEVAVAGRWRARRWRLCAPAIVPVGPAQAVIEGAVGAAARRRLTEAAARTGGVVRSYAVSAWTPDVLVVSGLTPAALAEELGWPLLAGSRPQPARAPDCWLPERRTVEGREIAGLWSFERGRFEDGSSHTGPWRLERWVRDRGDDRDVFRLVGPKCCWTTTSRTAAVLEAHRRAGQALFVWSAGALNRTGAGGHLPLPVAQALRRGSLQAAGPLVEPDGRAGYFYPARVAEARWVADLFGAAVRGPSDVQPGPSSLDRMVAARRSRRPFSWYAPRTQGAAS